MTKYSRRSTMTGAAFREIRERLGLSVQEAARLLDCRESSVYSLETGLRGVGRQLALLVTLLEWPGVRDILAALADERQHTRNR